MRPAVLRHSKCLWPYGEHIYLLDVRVDVSGRICFLSASKLKLAQANSPRAIADTNSFVKCSNNSLRRRTHTHSHTRSRCEMALCAAFPTETELPTANNCSWLPCVAAVDLLPPPSVDSICSAAMAMAIVKAKAIVVYQWSHPKLRWPNSLRRNWETLALAQMGLFQPRVYGG